jgi:hypothetical protein
MGDLMRQVLPGREDLQNAIQHGLLELTQLPPRFQYTSLEMHA